MKICLDPGHGGKDPGAIGPNRTKEKDIVLSVSHMLFNILVQQKHSVTLTRAADFFIPLWKRAEIANDIPTDIFISIHCNSSTSPKSHGWEIWTSPGETGADALATHIGQAWKQDFSQMRIRSDFSDGDVDKERNLAVLRKTFMPAVLVELQFLNNPKWETFLKSQQNQKAMAQTIAEGVETWQNTKQLIL